MGPYISEKANPGARRSLRDSSVPVQTATFRARMEVSLVDGPVTIVFDIE
jgi:D-Tyr-tRNAtyr deacylase